jgi:hypothetical protein
MKLEFSRQIFEKYSATKFHENPFSGSWLVVAEGQTDRQTDRETGMMKLIVALYNFAKAPSKKQFRRIQVNLVTDTHEAKTTSYQSPTTAVFTDSHHKASQIRVIKNCLNDILVKHLGFMVCQPRKTELRQEGIVDVKWGCLGQHCPILNTVTDASRVAGGTVRLSLARTTLL